jgi:hypothetical protein
MLLLLQGLMSAVLWQALQLLEHFGAALHASQAEWHVVWLQGVVSAMLWQALQALTHAAAALHANHAEWHVVFAAGVGVSYAVAGTAGVDPCRCSAACKSC